MSKFSNYDVIRNPVVTEKSTMIRPSSRIR